MITQDTRKLSQGDIYVALRGGRFDGHDFVTAAFEKGASEAWVCADWTPPKGVTGRLRRFSDTRLALADEARRYRQTLAATVIGVTGSAGKTTTKELLATAFSRARRTRATEGNYNNDIGLPLTLLNLPRNVEVAIVEAGTNHPGEIANLAGIMQPAAAVITGIGPAHIEYFGSLKAIAREKGALLAALPKDGLAVLPMEDPLFSLLASMAPCRVISTSVHDRAADYCSDALDLPGLELSGDYNRSNVVLAYAMAREQGLTRQEALDGLQTFRPLAMRGGLQIKGPYRIVDDTYNANPLSMTCAVQAFAQRQEASKVLCLGDMLELGEHARDLHRKVGFDAAGRGDWRLLVLVGQEAKAIADGAIEAGYPSRQIRTFATAEEAANHLGEWLREGDCLMLKASRGIHLERIIERLPIN
ncbi:MAG: UDP-N-acetylmuramoyl-tripeptide--D-alanyl-D-alanine ligase [Kiritimatiellia bacterium]